MLTRKREQGLNVGAKFNDFVGAVVLAFERAISDSPPFQRLMVGSRRDGLEKLSERVVSLSSNESWPI